MCLIGNFIDLVMVVDVPHAWSWFVAFACGALIGNRVMILAATVLCAEERRGVRWSAMFGYLGTLPLAIPAGMTYAAPYLAFFAFVMTFALFTSRNDAPTLLLIVFSIVVAIVLLAGLLLLGLATSAAIIESVGGRATFRAFTLWLREAFRPREVKRNLVPAIVLSALVFVPGFAVWYGLWFASPAVQYLAFLLCEAIFEAAAICFAYEWRNAVLNQRYGRDLEAALDQPGSTSGSPTAISPGVSTSQ